LREDGRESQRRVVWTRRWALPNHKERRVKKGTGKGEERDSFVGSCEELKKTNRAELTEGGNLTRWNPEKISKIVSS